MISASSPVVDFDGDWDRLWRDVRVGGASGSVLDMVMTAMSTTMIDAIGSSVLLGLD